MAMNKKKNKKKLACLAAALAIVTLLAGTFAWIQSKDDVLNELSTDQITDTAVVIQEVFTPPKSWDPGVTVDKQVSLLNTGDRKALVRVGLEEILYLVNNGGVPKTTATYDDASVLTGQLNAEDNWIPVTVNVDAFWDSTLGVGVNGWVEVPLTDITNSLDPLHDGYTAASDVIILQKETLSVTLEKSFGYFAFREVGPGVYQKVDLGKINTVLYTAADTIPPGKVIGDVKEIELVGNAASQISFYWYDGRTQTQDRTADTTKYVTNSTTPLSGLSPAYTPSFAVNPFGSGANTYLDSPLDATAMVALGGTSSMIKINFADDGVTPVADAYVTTVLSDAITKNIWYYNQDDGYFYYMDTVDPGMATKMLISSLTMDSAASVEHTLMDYKLGIVSEAIQNTEAAITAVPGTGWEVTDPALLAALHALCDD